VKRWLYTAASTLILIAPAVTLLRATPEEPILEILLVKTKEEADAIRLRIKSGESFELLASQYSIDATSAEGGYLGPVKSEYLLPEIREALKSVGDDGLSSVFPAPMGYMVLKLLQYPRETARTTEGRPSWWLMSPDSKRLFPILSARRNRRTTIRI
jgi:hypothetical protein